MARARRGPFSPRSPTPRWRCIASLSGAGPGAAKIHISDNLVACVLTDVFTPAERTLIEAGQEARVARAAHRAATDAIYKERMEAVLGRPVEAHLSSVDVAPDVDA